LAVESLLGGLLVEGMENLPLQDIYYSNVGQPVFFWALALVRVEQEMTWGHELKGQQHMIKWRRVAVRSN
jgi:hypothetical protein